MKRFFRVFMAGMLSAFLMGSSVMITQQRVQAETTYELPTVGVFADGYVGEGIFDTTSIDIVPYAEHGITQNNLRIEYLESSDSIVYSYYTHATDSSTDIGMNPLNLQRWNDSTQRWETIAAGSPMDHNTYVSRNVYSYSSPVHNRYYRVVGYHYAKINGQTYTIYNETQYIKVP